MAIKNLNMYSRYIKH